MTNFQEIRELAKELRVLYAEDDAQTQRVMKGLLEDFFGHVYVANNGQEGIDLFKQHRPDLVLSDINMPKVSGIEMVRAIRSVDGEIPVMLITAYSDTHYLMDSIFLGVDRYVTKPLNEEEFFKHLVALLKGIHRKKEALAYQQERIKRQINEAALGALKETADIYPSPTFVFGAEQKLLFLNSAASKIFSQEELSLLLEGQSIDTFVQKREGCLGSIHAAQNREYEKIALKTKGHGRIFLLNTSTFALGESALWIVSLTDITRVEYEKQKSQNLSAYLHDLLRQTRKVLPLAPSEQRATKAPEAQAPKSYEQMRLSAMHAVHKESAREYVEGLNAQVMEELQEMEELENEMQETFVELEEYFNLSSLQSIGRHFEWYGRTIGLLVDFEDVAYSLKTLAEFLLGLNNVEFNQKKMLILLRAISEDLENWRRVIFVEQASNDIHYLDASLLSSCLQIKMDFGPQEQGQDDDLEFF